MEGEAGMTLDDYNKQIVVPMILRQVESGRLDNAIYDPDCADINYGPEVQAAIDARKAILEKRV